MKQFDVIINDWQGNIKFSAKGEYSFFNWYYVYTDDIDVWGIPYAQINKKVKSKFKIQSTVLPLIDETKLIWNIYQWMTVSNTDYIGWDDEFEKDSLTGWVMITDPEDKAKTWIECVDNFIEREYRLNGQREEFKDFKIEQDKEKKIIHTQIIKSEIKKNKPTKYRKSRGFKDLCWSTLVKERDANKCTQCNSDQNLHAHHIKPYKDNIDLRYDVNNGITLCSICHINYHKSNGYK